MTQYKSYNDDLASITRTITNLLDLVNHSIELVEETIINPDEKIIQEISRHDYKINNLDQLAEKQITTLLTLRQPFALEMRYVISALRVSADLERMGDKCKSAVKNLLDSKTKIDSNTKESLLKMLSIAKKMINDSVLCFNTRNAEKSQDILQKDDKIDQIYRDLFSIIDGNNFDKSEVKNIVNTIFIAKNLERLADHATNIAEMTHYVVTGEIIE
jgi:phosphate transport system protein